MKQITIDEYLEGLKTGYTYNRHGEKVPAPEWAPKERCANCKYWAILAECEQPADGWGIKGICTSHRGQGRYRKDAFSYCQDHTFEDKE